MHEKIKPTMALTSSQTADIINLVSKACFHRNAYGWADIDSGRVMGPKWADHGP